MQVLSRFNWNFMLKKTVGITADVILHKRPANKRQAEIWKSCRAPKAHFVQPLCISFLKWRLTVMFGGLLYGVPWFKMSFSRLFSYLYSCKVLTGFLPLCFGMPCMFFFLSRLSKLWMCRSPSSPRASATYRRLIPLSNIRWISANNACTFCYFFAI